MVKAVHGMRRIVGLLLFFGTVVFAADGTAAAGKVIQLPEQDRRAIEKLLGKGVVGAPVPAGPIADASKFMSIRDSSWTFRFVNGDKKGKTEKDVLKSLKRDKSGATGRLSVGSKTVLFLRRSADGSLSVVSEEDLGQGVISRFSPPEPGLISGVKPGERKRMTIGVKVYDLSSPKEVSHSGSLDVTYSYIGAYKVTVPAGSYDAVLLKWNYKGSVGPASIKDVQYRFVAEGVGVVASIDRKNISAVLIYHDNSKYGKVLTAKE